MAERVDKDKLACNKPKRTPSHPTKSHIVKACEGGKEKIIRFGDANMKIKKKNVLQASIHIPRNHGRPFLLQKKRRLS